MINKSVFDKSVKETAYWSIIDRNNKDEEKYFKQPFKYELASNQLYCEVRNDRFIKPCPICGERPNYCNAVYKDETEYSEIDHRCSTDKFGVYINFACRCEREHTYDAECDLAVYNRWNEVVDECEEKIKEKKESLESIDVESLVKSQYEGKYIDKSGGKSYVHKITKIEEDKSEYEVKYTVYFDGFYISDSSIVTKGCTFTYHANGELNPTETTLRKVKNFAKKHDMTDYLNLALEKYYRTPNVYDSK